MDLDSIAETIIEKRRHMDRNALLVGISGIDASGKGFISEKLASRLESIDQRVALINIDGWLNLPHIRFSDTNPGRHFYHHALRLEEAFGQLVKPLKQNREIDITIDFAEETAREFRTHRYRFDAVDIVILEGIFLFKKQYREAFDLRIWIESSFERAVERAIGRGQEGLSAAETTTAYETIYFPAQRYHLAADHPRHFAHVIINNE